MQTKASAKEQED